MTLIYVVMSLAIISILGIVYWLYTKDTYIVRIKKNQVMEFKSSFELTGLPIIVFYQGDKKYFFLFDSGSNMTYINQASDIKRTVTGSRDTFMGVNGIDMDFQRAVVNLYRDSLKYETEVGVADLTSVFDNLKNEFGVTLTGIIGCDFMNKYSYCLDFKELVIYARK